MPKTNIKESTHIAALELGWCHFALKWKKAKHTQLMCGLWCSSVGLTAKLRSL